MKRRNFLKLLGLSVIAPKIGMEIVDNMPKRTLKHTCEISPQDALKEFYLPAIRTQLETYTK